MNVFSAAASALRTCDVDEKLELTAALARDWQAERLTFELPDETDIPVGRPVAPRLVGPAELPMRSPHTLQGRASLMHAIAHIEFNAINLALDHITRFPTFPKTYLSGWITVAVEEAYHFTLVRGHLKTLGYAYGDFPAHEGLWQMAMRTAHDPLARMALVPRLLEARGLDATPQVQRKLTAVGDLAAVEVLEIILRDEVAHVALGDHWFRVLCAERNLDVEDAYRRLLDEYAAPWPQLPLNEEARQRAGFSRAELDMLTRGRRKSAGPTETY